MAISTHASEHFETKKQNAFLKELGLATLPIGDEESIK